MAQMIFWWRRIKKVDIMLRKTKNKHQKNE